MLRNFFYKIIPCHLYKKIIKWEKEQMQRQTAIKIEALVSSKEIVYLEIGSGPKKGIKNWITIDICDGCDIKHNLAEGIPFPSNSVDMIYSSHLLEHFYYKELLLLLHECYRVLKYNARFSACVPNAAIYINKYLNPNDVKLQKLYEPAFTLNSPIDYINYIAYMDTNHRYMFDENNMIAILSNIGFRNIALREFDPTVDKEERNWESIYFDALK
jgi:predicted SAM-dependent methyltransferase